MITLKEISLKDVIQLQKLAKQTFYETFSNYNTEENLQKYLATGFSVEKLNQELSNKNSIFHIAYLENKPIGYLKINFGNAQTELKEDNSAEIERIYILQKYQGQNIGNILIEKAKHMAQEKKINYIWLGVWEHNSKAIKFYTRHGFEIFDQHIFIMGGEKQKDIMMRLIL